METVLFDRRCRLTISTPVSTPNDFKTTTSNVLQIEGGTGANAAGLRVSFRVTKTLKKEPNTGEIIVTNLNEDHRKQAQTKGAKVQLEAGYASRMFQVFSGDIRTADPTRNGTNWDMKLALGDGERSYQHAKVYESFGPGTSFADVLKKAVGGLGIDEGNLSSALQGFSKVFDQGFSLAGPAAKSVDQLVKSINKTWSVQDGKFQMLGKDETAKNTVPLISPDSGLVGQPEIGAPAKKGGAKLVTLKALLMPATPGMKIHLKSERYDGLLRVESCEFSGDTHGGEWYTTFHASILK